MTVPLLSEADVRSLATLREVIDSLDDVLRREQAGTALNIAKSMAVWPPASSAHTLGGVDLLHGLSVFKNWVNTPTGATAVLTMFDSTSGQVIAILEAAYLGSLRTAGVAGLATRVLAPRDATELAIIGSGRQALRQVEAVLAVRDIHRVRVWSPTEEHRRRFADEVNAAFGVPAVASPTPEAAIDAAAVVTVVTRAREPFVSADLLAHSPVVHVNAMGAVLASNAELEPDVVTKADLVVVDALENARAGSRELREALGPSLDGVRTLGELLAGGGEHAHGSRLTVFKAMGMGLSDLAAAAVVARNAGLVRSTS
jgi:alanine dehydrogenase